MPEPIKRVPDPVPTPMAAASATVSTAATSAEGTGRISIPLSPNFVMWIAPVCLVIVGVLALFFSWNGSYPGGHGVYTQGAFKSLFGKINVDSVGEIVLKMNPTNPAEGQTKLQDSVKSNWLMLLYLPLLYGSIAIAIIATILDQLPVKVPVQFQKYLPYRPLLVAGLAGILTILLGLQAFMGFGLEKAMMQKAKEEADKIVKREFKPSDPETDEDVKKREIVEGLMQGGIVARQTVWLRISLLLQFFAFIGGVLTFMFTKRADHPPPKIEFVW
jgi:hypothetical protein